MNNDTQKIYTQRFITLFFAILLLLFLIGSFFDYPIGQAFANSESKWATFLQNGGAFPNVLLSVFAGEILYQKSIRLKNQFFKIISIIFSFLFPLTRFWSYLIEILDQFDLEIAEVKNDFSGTIFVILYILCYFVFHYILQTTWLSKKSNTFLNKLMVIGIAGVVVDTATSTIVNQIKDYVSRPRPFIVFSGEATFKRWFEINGMLGSGDFTSFPSGHTRCFFMSLYFPMFVENNIKLKKFWLYMGIIYSFLGAFSRIVMTKHYLSDVMMGGIIAFLGICAIIKLFRFEDTDSIYKF